MMSMLILAVAVNIILFFEKAGGRALSLVINLFILAIAVLVPVLNKQTFFPAIDSDKQSAISVKNNLTSNLECFLLGPSNRGFTVLSKYSVISNGSAEIQYSANGRESLLGCKEMGLSRTNVFYLKKFILEIFQEDEIIINKADVDKSLVPYFSAGIKSTNLEKLLKYAALFFFAAAALHSIINLVRIQAEFRLQSTLRSDL